MDCRTAEAMITPYIQHELSDEDLEAFLNHIHSCPSCRSELEMDAVIVEGLRMLDSGSDNFDLKDALDRQIRASYQHLRAARTRKIVIYSINTLVFLSVVGTLLLELRILFY